MIEAGAQAAISIRNLSKTFASGRQALVGVDLTIGAGEMVALIGASGSGKSTLLRHIAGLMAGDAGAGGEVHIHALPVQRGGRVEKQVRSVRAQVGFVFQQFNLVDRLPVIVNVLAGTLHRLPLWRRLGGFFPKAEVAAAYEVLRQVGIAETGLQRASTLSGGQQQRAAIARAMLQGARVILADEPIASLDPESSRLVMELLATLNRESGSTVVVSLHQVNVAMKYCPRTVALHRGRVVYDGPSAALTPAMLRELYGAEADEILATGDAIASLQDAVAKPPSPAAAARLHPYLHAA